MELDELKKSWNILNEHLKDKKLISEEDITKLITPTKKNIKDMSRFNIRILIISLFIAAIFIAASICSGVYPDLYLQILLIFIIPATSWDIFSIRFMSHTKLDEMPLIAVISRFNRIHKWMICERIVSVLCIFSFAVFYFINEQLWKHNIVLIIIIIALWSIGLAICLSFYRKNTKHLHEIRKNLDELKELKEDN